MLDTDREVDKNRLIQLLYVTCGAFRYIADEAQ